MAFDTEIADKWYDSTGFLYGNDPVVDPDDPYRISTYIMQTYPPMTWAPLAEGALYPGAPAQLQGGSSSYTPIFYETYLGSLDNYRPTQCLSECSMGGCDDPTAWSHPACVKAGCCSDAAWKPPSPPLLDMQTSYIVTECKPGTKEYCRSYLDYFNCMPWSTLTPETDSSCADYRPTPLPW
jgi:hypothetical protein